MRTKTRQPVLADSTTKPRELAPALSRGINILALIAQSRRAWSLTEIASELGLAKSSVFALCKTLVASGFLERQGDGTYRLGLRLVDLANARLEDSDLPGAFYKTWDSLGVFRQEAVILSVRDATEMVYIACRNSPLPLGVTFRIGMRLPACCTATGKACLSTLPEDEVRAIYKKHSLVRLTAASVRSLDDLLAQLAIIRKRGYSIDDGETRAHMCSFGAPVFDRGNVCAVAGVAISFLKASLDAATRARAGEVVKQFAGQLSKSLGAVQVNQPSQGARISASAR
jgi:IclR family transcriptional regulator, blcABC operon repressor